LIIGEYFDDIKIPEFSSPPGSPSSHRKVNPAHASLKQIDEAVPMLQQLLASDFEMNNFTDKLKDFGKLFSLLITNGIAGYIKEFSTSLPEHHSVQVIESLKTLLQKGKENPEI
jgi:hypothetical protein